MMQSSSDDRKSGCNRNEVLILALLLGIHAVLAAHTAWRKSVTVDEVAHLPAGLSYWQTGRFALYHHNPPLVKLLSSFPLFIAGVRVDLDSSPTWQRYLATGLPPSQWNVGWEFMYQHAEHYQEIYFVARLVIISLSVLTGVFVYRWSRKLFGARCGLIAAALWCFSPNAIAHGSLVTTDMGATASGFMATYLFWRYLESPSWRGAAVAGFALGAAQVTKFSMLLLYPVWFAIACLYFFKQRPKQFRLDHLLLTVALSVVVINSCYLFRGTLRPLGSYTFLSDLLTVPRTEPLPEGVARGHPWRQVLESRQNRFAGTLLGLLPVPLPAEYVLGFDEQKMESEGIDGMGYPVYLCGQLRRTGWWWYYPFAMLVKVPLGTWLLTAAAISALFVGTQGVTNTRLLALAVFPVSLLLAMSFIADIDLGLRYVLPIFPYWFVLASSAVMRCNWPPNCWTAIVTLACTLNIAACRHHPNHLAYFNELVGGPDKGGYYLIDSNLDWGQDLLELSRWIKKRSLKEPIGLAYFGNVDPSILQASGQGFEFYLAPPASFDQLELRVISAGSRVRAIQLNYAGELLSSISPAVTGEERLRAVAERVRGPILWEESEPRAEIAESLGLFEGPRPGWYAISANFVFGLPFRLRDQEGNLWHAETGAYEYFRHASPDSLVAKAGYSIFIYHFDLGEANRLRALLGLPLLEWDRGN